jgi:NADH:ubiquinone oxidoreductase subunit F (NADH-binding)/(2Fe-2S) ferredoxin
MICAGTGCVSNKSFKVKEALNKEIKKFGLENEVLVVATGCHGFCAQGPIILVKPDDIFYQLLTEEDIPRLVEEHLLKGRPLEEKMYFPPEEKTPIPKISDIKFFNKQRLIVLKNRGIIDPEDIRDYIARGGYQALTKALTRMTPEGIVKEIKDSGLRGRGGAGFPTGKKWESCRNAHGNTKYIICNADEGDPGAFMDRSIIESDPHSVLEGMIIGAKAIGAACGYVYIRSEYPLAVKRLHIAIDECRRYGLLGKDIMGTGFNFDITVFRGAGAFVCGESSALRASIEGKSPEPQAKFIHATEKGLWDKPTVLNNVETLANVPTIIERGASWFAKIGTENSKGTKVFSLAGKVNNIGLVEVPMGITLKEIIIDIGGGIPKGKRFKAVQTGGPSGGCIPESLIDLPVDFDRLAEVGSMMGSGGMIVMDENTCTVDIARYFLDFLRGESCGKCVSCREGIEAMYEILVDICEGNGRSDDIELLEEIAEAVRSASMCALGKTAPNPVLSTLRYFKDEYEAHIERNRCPAGVCKNLIHYRIDVARCTACMLCMKSCSVGAISGEKKQPQKIDVEKCIKCGTCFEVCKFKAVIVE